MSNMNTINENTNITTMAISEVIDKLKDMYLKHIEKNIPFKNIPSVFLWGPPGVGKSDGVFELAKHIDNNTDKTVVVSEIHLFS